MQAQVTPRSVDRQWARDNLCPHCYLMGRVVLVRRMDDALSECPRCGSRFKGDDLQEAWDEAENYLIIRKADMEEVA